MQAIDDTWTHAHDLTLVFLALCYGSKQQLKDSEIDAIASSLARWKPAATRTEINEIVLESVAVFLESDPEREVVQSVHALRDALSLEKRREALEDIMRIAEADGVLLNSEQNLLSIVADIWDIRATKERLMHESLASTEEHPDWSLLHDIALIYIMMAHGADEELSSEEITAIKQRLAGWAPDVSDEEVTSVARESLQFYASDPTREELQSSVTSVAKHMSRAQRLVVLNDLMVIAESDGEMTGPEHEMIESLSAAWKVDIRVARPRP